MQYVCKLVKVCTHPIPLSIRELRTCLQTPLFMAIVQYTAQRVQIVNF